MSPRTKKRSIRRLITRRSGPSVSGLAAASPGAATAPIGAGPLPVARGRGNLDGGRKVDSAPVSSPPMMTPTFDLPPELDDPLFRTAIGQLDGALDFADVSPYAAAKLRYPERGLSVAIPVRLDDGSLAVYPGYRVQ